MLDQTWPTKSLQYPNMHVYDFMKGKNKKSMYVEDVNKDEMVKIVNNFTRVRCRVMLMV